MGTEELDSLPIPQLYDRVFKRLMYLSKPVIISFINALFGTNHPCDSEMHPTRNPQPLGIDNRELGIGL